MFSGSLVWKGLVYSLLMMLAKMLVCVVVYFQHFKHIMKIWIKKKTSTRKRKKRSPAELMDSLPAINLPSISNPEQEVGEADIPRLPHSIALLVGCAMMARGEIGFLIASLSQSSGTLALQISDGTTSESSGEDVFLVIIWAVVLCTIAGPVGVGILVRRLKEGNVHSNWL